MDKSRDELSVTLAGYISTLQEQVVSNEGEDSFPDKHKLKSGNEEHIKIIVEQGKKLLDLIQGSMLFGLNYHPDDKSHLIELFSSDLEQFATERGLHLGGKHILSYGQSRIPEHALFHLAASSLLPNTYTTIQQNAGLSFNLYSVPFKIRVSLENIKNIYQWSCGFCHTGEKEPLWLSMKALELISPLFIYKCQKMYEIDASDLWHKYVISKEYFEEKARDQTMFPRPVYMFRTGWSVNKLQTHLNKPENPKRKYKRGDAKEIIFNLSEKELIEVECYYCSRTKESY